MPDRREALRNISSSLTQTVDALQALTEPNDSDLPIGMRHLLDAIDRFELAADAVADRRPGA